MKPIYRIFFVSILLLLFSCGQRTPSSATKQDGKDTVPVHADTATGRSVYQLDGTWKNQDDRQIRLADLGGKVQIVAMIFSNCKYACPKIVEDMKKIARKIPADQMKQVGFTLISFDVERDNPAQLKKFAAEMKLDKHWTLLHGEEQQVRELSLVLDVQYEKQDDGTFAHSNVITVLDQQGVIATRQEGLDVDPGSTVRTIVTLLQP
jgi:protein SCO1/2